MDTRYLILRRLVMAVASLACADGQAQDVQVNFTGNLLSSTCEVSANSSGTGDATVWLPIVSTVALNRVGARAGRSFWQLQVGTASNPCLVPRVQVGFRNSGNVNPAGRLNNAGVANNVDVVLTNRDDGDRDINLVTNANSQVRTVPTDGYVFLNYAAEYYATGQAGVGSVSTSVQYDIIYP